MNVTFFAWGSPKPQPRPRAFARNMGAGKFAARVYDAGTAEGWKASVALAAKAHLPPEPCAHPLSVDIQFTLPRPQSHFTTKGDLRAAAPFYPTNKMDCDNLAKAVLDALTQIGMWLDDGQIVHLSVSKNYGPKSGAQVTIRTMP